MWEPQKLHVLQRSGQAPGAKQVAGARRVSRGEAMRSRSPQPAARAPRGVLGLQTSPLLVLVQPGAFLRARYLEINKIYILKEKIPPKHVILSLCYAVLWAYSVFLAPVSGAEKGSAGGGRGAIARFWSAVCSLPVESKSSVPPCMRVTLKPALH